MGLLAGPFEKFHRLPLRPTDAVKVDFGGRPILVAEDPLDGAEGYVVKVQ